MSNPLTQILDLAQLAFPGRFSTIADGVFVRVDLPSGEPDFGLDPGSLDSFARVFRALPKPVRERFERGWGQNNGDWFIPPRSTVVVGDLLAADPDTLWPLLHRAAFGDGVVNK